MFAESFYIQDLLERVISRKRIIHRLPLGKHELKCFRSAASIYNSRQWKDAIYSWRCFLPIFHISTVIWWNSIYIERLIIKNVLAQADTFDTLSHTNTSLSKDAEKILFDFASKTKTLGTIIPFVSLSRISRSFHIPRNHTFQLLYIVHLKHRNL